MWSAWKQAWISLFSVIFHWRCRLQAQRLSNEQKSTLLAVAGGGREKYCSTLAGAVMHVCSQTSISSTTTNPNVRSADWAVTGRPPTPGEILQWFKAQREKKIQLRQPQWAAELQEDQMTQVFTHGASSPVWQEALCLPGVWQRWWLQWHHVVVHCGLLTTLYWVRAYQGLIYVSV